MRESEGRKIPVLLCEGRETVDDGYELRQHQRQGLSEEDEVGVAAYMRRQSTTVAHAEPGDLTLSHSKRSLLD